MSDKHKHLEFIQGVINRLSSNSFSVKGSSVLLVSAFFALMANDDLAAVMCLAYFPVIIFWGLDGFFLWQEQLFRKLYDRVRVLPEEKIDFSMNISAITGKDCPTWVGATLSKTLIPFHIVLIIGVTMGIGIVFITQVESTS